MFVYIIDFNVLECHYCHLSSGHLRKLCTLKLDMNQLDKLPSLIGGFVMVVLLLIGHLVIIIMNIYYQIRA